MWWDTEDFPPPSPRLYIFMFVVSGETVSENVSFTSYCSCGGHATFSKKVLGILLKSVSSSSQLRAFVKARCKEIVSRRDGKTGPPAPRRHCFCF